MTTVSESVDKKIKSRQKWKAANPGLDWNTVYAEEEGKIYITRELLESKAYRSLGRVSLLVYQDFLAKRIFKAIKRDKKRVWICENNGNLVYPYSEAVEKGFSRDQFRSAIDQLQSKGLLDIRHQGQGGPKIEGFRGDSTRYMLDNRWKDYGTDEFRPARKPRKKDHRKGRGWMLYHKKKKPVLILRKGWNK